MRFFAGDQGGQLQRFLKADLPDLPRRGFRNDQVPARSSALRKIVREWPCEVVGNSSRAERQAGV
jgi:hypothetical protein